MKRYRLYRNIRRRTAEALPAGNRPAIVLTALALAALALTGTGCSDENNGNPATDETAPLVVEEVKAGSWAEGTTRTTQEVETLPKYLIVMKEDATGEGERKTYTTVYGNGWTSEDPLLLGKATKVYAFGMPRTLYSDNLDVARMDSKSIYLKYYKYSEEIPVPYYSEPKTLSARNPAASFEMKHLYTRLTLKLKSLSDIQEHPYNWDGKITKIIISGEFWQECNCFLPSGKWGGVFGSIELPYSGADIGFDYTTIADLMIPLPAPSPSEGHGYMHITIINNTDPANVEDKDAPQFEGYFKYTPHAGEWGTIEMTVKQQGIVFDSSDKVKFNAFIDSGETISDVEILH